MAKYSSFELMLTFICVVATLFYIFVAFNLAQVLLRSF